MAKVIIDHTFIYINSVAVFVLAGFRLTVIFPKFKRGRILNFSPKIKKPTANRGDLTIRARGCAIRELKLQRVLNNNKNDRSVEKKTTYIIIYNLQHRKLSFRGEQSVRTILCVACVYGMKLAW